MKIEQIISDAAVKAVKALYGIEAAPGTTVPQKTKKEFEGNRFVQCNQGLSQFGDRSFVLEPDVASHRRGGRFRDA